MTFRISIRMHIMLFGLSLLFTLIFYKFFTGVLINFIYYMKPLFSRSILINFYIHVLLLITVISFVHELIHGLFYFIYGGKVSFGFKGIYAYCREKSSLELSRTKFLIVLLAPLVIISMLSLPLMKYSGIIFILNLLGSCGDIYMAFSLSKLKPENRVIDREYGYEVV